VVRHFAEMVEESELEPFGRICDRLADQLEPADTPAPRQSS
jgi:hypothetical protein